MNNRSIIITFLLVFILAACSTNPTPATTTDEVVGETVAVDGGSYTDVTVPELQTMLQNKDFVFINVHIPFEGDIEGTDISIPYDQITDNLEKIPDKNAKIVLYCRSGRMSDIAARELVNLGYNNVWNLSGGMVAWEQAGLDIKR